MRLTSLHIDGFGMFADRGFDGFAPGINVLYGLNEDGKTTLLEFIRRILFGFPTRRENPRQYEPLNGGKQGGRLVCEMADGTTVTIERVAGAHGGPATVRFVDGREEAGADISPLLGRITATVYHNVFAVGLTDLQAAEALEHDDVTGLIYGAGFGLSARALSKTRARLKSRADDLFRPRGSKQHIPRMLNELTAVEKEIADISRHLGQYDALVENRDDLDRKIVGIKAELNARALSRRRIESTINVYAHFVKWQSYDKEKADLSETPDVPDEQRHKLQELDDILMRLREDVERVKKQSSLIRDRLGRVSLNQAVIDAEGVIRELMRSSEMYRKAQEDIGGVRQELKAAETNVAAHLARLGGDWSEDTLHGFHVTVEQATATEKYRDRLQESRQRRERARDALENARRQETIRQDIGTTANSAVRPLAFAVAFLGAVGLIWAVTQSQWLSAGLALAVTAGALAIAFGTGVKRTSPTEISLDIYQKSYDEAAAAHETLKTEWKKLPASLGLDEATSPDGFMAVLQEIKGLREAVTSRDRLQERVGRMETTIAAIDAKYRDLSDRTGACEGVSAVVSGIELLQHALDEAQARRLEREQLRQQSADLKREQDDIHDRLNKNDARRRAIIASTGAADMDELRRRLERLDRRKELAGLLRECELAMQTAVGTGEAFERFIREMQATTPEEMRRHMASLDDELADLDGRHDEAIRESQRLTGEINTLASRDDIYELQEKRETLTSRLADAAEQWAVARLAEMMLERTVGAYERDRQPEVIRNASEVFGRITGGRYGSIRKPVDSPDLEIIEAVSGRKKSVDRLSRGTREQLYLAMRLGLIAEYERRAEPLPIILDDVLVNFDDRRGRQTVAALIEFARDRQVLVMTCHRQIYETYRELGAHPVPLASV